MATSNNLASLQVQLLRAGACFDNSGGGAGSFDFVKCALQPKECTNSSGYRSSLWLSGNNVDIGNLCGSQDAIHQLKAVGRCNANQERNICTSSPSACHFPDKFDELDANCNLVQDFLPTSPFTSSHYGSCFLPVHFANNNNNNAVAEAAEAPQEEEDQSPPPFCVWDEQECHDFPDVTLEGIDYTYQYQNGDPFYPSPIGDCQCDAVKTGACIRQGSTTAEDWNFFCAVSPSVCEATHDATYVYLKPHEVEQQFQKTCRLCDTLPPPPQVHYIEGGACISADDATTNGNFEKCALVPSDCAMTSQFHSSLTLLRSMKLSIPTAPLEALECLSQEQVQGIHVGRCTGNNANGDLCTSHKSGCRFAIGFQPNDHQCTITRDTKPNTQSSYHDSTTHYGHCSTKQGSIYEEGTEAFCAWANTDCDKLTPNFDANEKPLMYTHADVGWSSLSNTTTSSCDCTNVRTGACVSKSKPKTERFCAVSEEACVSPDNDLEFVKVRDLESRNGHNMICYLCDAASLVPAPTMGGIGPASSSSTAEISPQPTITPPPQPSPSSISPTTSPGPTPSQPAKAPNNPPSTTIMPTPRHTTTSSVTVTTTTSSTSGSSSNSHNNNHDTGAIVGMTIGVLVGAVALAGLATWNGKRAKQKLQQQQQQLAAVAYMNRGGVGLEA